VPGGREQDDLPRPVVTVDGSSLPPPPPDLLVAGPDRPPRSGRPSARALVSGVRQVLAWAPRRDVVRPLLAASTALLVAGAASAVALELRDPSTDPADVLAATLDAGSFRIDFAVERLSDGAGLGPGTEVQLDESAACEADVERSATHLEVRAEDGGDVSFEVVRIGRDTWIRHVVPEGARTYGDYQPDGLQDDQPWLHSTNDELGASFLGPDCGLRRLLEGAQVVDELPRGEVEGDRVSRVAVLLADNDDEGADDEGADGEAAEDGGDSADELAPEEQRAQMSVDRRGRLRQVVIEQVSDELGTSRTTMTVSRAGKDLGIQPPPEDQVRDEDAFSS
jgi:hypothetical protein